ncbi:hypothetical protein GCM10022384_31930 [Streptomyces marokkonensis]|uniref:4Fe-4S Wbl-type domain-containing protein n=1 Tax=Streptomyces marokkonensis TaxID=324855 RepID=A0ABP7QD98_9ACTN
MRRAACVDEDPELFFPVGTGGPGLRDTEAAGRVCARRPVRAQCLAFALDLGQTSGVWAGTCEEERVAPPRTTALYAHRATKSSRTRSSTHIRTTK